MSRNSAVWLCLFLSSCFATGCFKEPALAPTALKPQYRLPQGNHAYDADIVSFYGQYRTFILYEFNHTDFAYNIVEMLSDSAHPGNPEYVGQALGFLFHNCLDFYSPAFLKETLPYKILLASQIDSIVRNLDGSILESYVSTGFRSSGNMMAFGWANNALTELPTEQLNILKGRLHRMYWQYMAENAEIKLPDSFYVLAPVYATVNASNMYEKGVINAPVGGVKNVISDFVDFVEVITSSSKASLESGILHPSIDVNGLIRQKYDIITTYCLNKYGIDLQSMGEHSVLK